MLTAIVACVLSQANPAPPGETISLLMVPLESNAIGGSTAAALGERVAWRLGKEDGFEVITMADINAQFTQEKLKDITGSDTVTVSSELGRALGARYLLRPSANILGPNLLLALSLIDNQSGKVKRGQGKAPKAGDLDPAVDAAVQELQGQEGKLQDAESARPQVPRGTVMQTMARLMGPARGCYQQTAPAKSRQVVVKLTLFIGVDGKVESAFTAAAPAQSLPLRACLIKLAKTAHFPATGVKRRLTYPFVFTSVGR